MFDEAIEELHEKNEKFDCVFIDGQHERKATMHYADRVLPLLNEGGSIIFDDIYWSEDMNRFWKEVCLRPEFATTIDLRLKGVAIRKKANEPKAHYDICEYLGRPRFSMKGW